MLSANMQGQWLIKGLIRKHAALPHVFSAETKKYVYSEKEYVSNVICGLKETGP